MTVKITREYEIRLPAAVLGALGVGPGDRLEFHEGPDGFLLRPQRINFADLAPLRNRIRRDPRPFDLEEFRNLARDSALRD